MRYLLVLQPTDLNGKGNTRMPLGLPYINGAMRAEGFDVEAINLQYTDEDPLGVLKETIVNKKIDVVMCGGITIEYPLIKAVFDAAREAKPNIITVGGGGGFSSEPILFSEMTGVDYAVIGEGEITDCELAHALDRGESVDDIRGLVIKKNEGYIYTGPRDQIKDLDSIAFPSYAGLQMDRYLDEQTVDGWYHTFAGFIDNPRIMPILMSRSCPFMCTFCYHPIGRGYRTRGMDSFFEELEGYIRDYRINAVALVDECFSIRPERVEEFCERIKPYNLFWSCQMRVETYSEPLIKKMVDSGCVSACFGLENMSQQILDDMNKKATVSQMKSALEVAYRNGGGVVSNILFGAETETEDTIRETMEWVYHNEKYTINDFVMIGAYPGSGYYEHAVRRGIIKDKRKFIEQGCPTINLTGLSETKFRALEMFSFLVRKEIRNKGEVISLEKDNDRYNAVLKCSHCGHINSYNGISTDVRKTKVLRTMVCRKCKNYSDYVFGDYREKWNTAKWLYDHIVGNKNDYFELWCRNNNVNKIAVYGLRFAGFFIEEFRKAGLDIEYGIDREYLSYTDMEIPVQGPNDDISGVDCVVVLAIESFEAIYKEMIKKTNTTIVSFEEVCGDNY
jgi:radical SAM superfamily enzyme YgiQ (UPF0313 family)